MPQAWSIEVELGVNDVSDDLVEELFEHLIDYSPAVGTAPNGHLSARIFVEAGTARQAIDSALREVTAAAKEAGIPATVVGVDLVTEEELDRRLAEPSVPDLVGVSEIADMFGVGRQRVTQLSQREDFPPAVARLKAGPVFVREQVVAFERRWDRRGGRPAKPVDLTPVERKLLARPVRAAGPGWGAGRHEGTAAGPWADVRPAGPREGVRSLSGGGCGSR